MLLLTSTSDLLRIVTTTPGDIDVHASWADFDGTDVTMGRTNTTVTAGAPTTTTLVASPAGSTTRNIKTLHIANVHASTSSPITVQHFDGTTSIDLESVTLLAGERLAYVEGQGFELVDANGVTKTNSTAAVFVKKLDSDQSNSTATLTKVTGLDLATTTGTYLFEYYIIYQSGATSTGVRFSVNHSGTLTSFAAFARFVDATALASTAAPSQAQVGAAGGVMGAFSARAKSTTGWGSTISTDATTDMLFVVEGLLVCTVAGNIELYHGSETTAISTVKAGTALRLTKVA